MDIPRAPARRGRKQLRGRLELALAEANRELIAQAPVTSEERGGRTWLIRQLPRQTVHPEDYDDA